ncbi:MAG: bifunctional methylenetetrahydrofolate dehydrogenase/methenyltetrahydrofolate cyclohydrolase FolD [Clostridia bacterium]|nr:bifunctional methylenetetrahydrofolate dehydrogenase/methenyltetrahydrofolate cyclohydrolase FolD [Clostridia bacterium]
MIIDGKSIAEKIKNDLKTEILELKSKGIIPTLAVVLVGENSASKIYVRNKKKACEEIGIYSEEFNLPENTSEDELIDLIEKLNSNSDINGILVQLPLPLHINEKKIAEAIDPIKDVDVFNPINTGRLISGDTTLIPCTPKGIAELFDYEKISLKGKHCVIIGRSNIVGKPLAMLMLQKDATVTICHSKTKNLEKICQNADIIIAAIGKPKFITKNMVKNGCVIIDVGINRNKDGTICGDADFDEVKDIASYITPVPGGVGPMTIAMLLENTIITTKMQNNIDIKKGEI